MAVVYGTTTHYAIRYYKHGSETSETEVEQPQAEKIDDELKRIDDKAGGMLLEVMQGIELDSGNITLSDEQAKNAILEVEVGSGSNAIIAPEQNGRAYWVVNKDDTNVARIQKDGGTPVEVGVEKRALVYFNGSEYVRLTDDQG